MTDSSTRPSSRRGPSGFGHPPTTRQLGSEGRSTAAPRPLHRSLWPRRGHDGDGPQCNPAKGRALSNKGRRLTSRGPSSLDHAVVAGRCIQELVFLGAAQSHGRRPEEHRWRGTSFGEGWSTGASQRCVLSSTRGALPTVAAAGISRSPRPLIHCNRLLHRCVVLGGFQHLGRPSHANSNVNARLSKQRERRHRALPPRRTPEAEPRRSSHVLNSKNRDLSCAASSEN